MQPNDPNLPRPDKRPIERSYVSRPDVSNFRRPVVPQRRSDASFQAPVSNPNVPPRPLQAADPVVAPVQSPQPRPAQQAAPAYSQQPFRSAPPQYSPIATAQPVPALLQDEQSVKKPAKMKSKRQRNWLLPVMIVIGLCLIGAITLLVIGMKAQNKPNVIFQQAFESTLSSHNVEVQTNNNGNVMTTKLDFTGSSGPQMSAMGDLSINGSNFILNGYGTLNNTYVQYTQLDNSTSQNSALASAVLNKWVQLRKNGDLSPGINASLANFADPNVDLAGDVVFGNFSGSESATLVKALIKSKVYEYNLSEVKQVTSDGQIFMEYPITINVLALKAWNQKILSAEGVPAKSIQLALANFGSGQPTTGIIYINKLSEQLIRLNLGQGSTGTSILYINRNNTTIESQPMDAVSYSQFAVYQNQIEQQAAQTESNTKLDAERKSDLAKLQQYIQNYYTSTGVYPTIYDMNNQVWVSVNFPGVNPDIFKDPQGSSLQLASAPVAKSYAYEPLGPNGALGCNDLPAGSKIGIICQSYKLVATLSNGQQYTVDNLD
jgi:hypothetical protein